MSESKCLKCTPNCIYFPQEPQQIISEYVSEDGVKRREVVRICGYDFEPIKNWEKICPLKLKKSENF